jgi:lipoprotein-anchoring transpeptidase ErfK/SrfK
MRRVLAVAAAPALAGFAVLAFAPRLRSEPVQAALPAPPHPAFVVPRPVPLRAVRDASRWAPVVQAVLARSAPTLHAAGVAWVDTRTPEGTTNVLEILGKARRGPRGLWLHVRLPVLPNGTTGWVARSALGGSVPVDTRLVIDRARFRATLFEDGRKVFAAPVGIGQKQSPTPVGDFYVRDVLTRYASSAYGPIAFGTSARAPFETDWPAGGYIGLHGTDQPGLIPGAISHGCIRLRNPDIRRLAALMPVGTPVIIQ